MQSKMEKEKINELKKNNESSFICTSTIGESIVSSESVDVDYLDLEFIRSKRKALDEEIRKLAGQLRTTDLKEREEKEAVTEKVDKEEKELNDNVFNEELDYTNYESDEDLDIPTEENFLKSSTSVSGDDDINDFIVSRPRSVHFEDEYWNDSQFVSDCDLTSSSGNTSGTGQMWSGGGSDIQTDSSDLMLSATESPSNPFLTKLKIPPLKSANKESVREILRKRREENVLNKTDLDSRRRIQPLQNKTQEKIRPRSRSRELKPRNVSDSKSSVHSSTSLESSADNGSAEQRYNRSIKYIGPKINLNSSIEPVISRKEYAHFRALAGGRGIIKELPKEISKNKRSNLQLKTAKVSDEFSSGRNSSSTPITNSYGWTASDHVGSPQSYSRYFGTKSQSELNGCSKTLPNYNTTSYESLKTLRACLDEDNKSQKTMMHRLDESMQRVSSGSSTDSSLPPLSSPVPSSSTIRTQSLNPSSGGSFAMPKFCYECGNKYPILQAKFCCQCGAPRVTVNG